MCPVTPEQPKSVAIGKPRGGHAMGNSRDPDPPGQSAHAEGHARTTQVAGDQNNYYQSRQGSLPHAQVALPAAPAHVVGRQETVNALLDLLESGSDTQSTVVISAVSGLAGIGKTTLALHVAHEAVRRGWFTGGALFVNLRGYDTDRQVTAEQSLEILLRALGLPEEHLPPTPEGKANLYRSELARLADEGKRVLLVVDNASMAAQVLPLVPARHEHRVLVTSRDVLASLQARLIELRELAPGPAARLIVNALARARPNDTRHQGGTKALAEVARYCGYLPLALEIVANILIADPGLSPAALAEGLADARSRLKTLHYEEGGQSLAVRTAFDLSYRRLPQDLKTLFCLLSLIPGADVSTEAVAALVAFPSPRKGLAALARTGLLNEQPVGGERWRMHDLIRLYADEQAEKYGPERCAEARRRLLAYYSTTLSAAVDRMNDVPAQDADRFTCRREAMTWVRGELQNLFAAVWDAAEHQPASAVSMARLLGPVLWRWRYYDGDIACTGLALGIAEELDLAEDTAKLCDRLGISLSRTERHTEALKASKKAVQLYRSLFDTDPEKFGPSLGRALANLSGRRGTSIEEWRTNAQEAVDVGRQWATATDPTKGELAGALHNLGYALSSLEKHTEALVPMREAVEIRRLQARARPGQFKPHLAHALGVWARLLTQADDAEAALSAWEEAVGLLQELASDDPFAHTHELAWRLLDQGQALSDLGRYSEAAVSMREAVQVWRRQVISELGGSESSVAGALRLLAETLIQAGQSEAAVVEAVASVSLWRELAAENPATHEESLFLAEMTLGAALGGTGQREKAQVACSRASSISARLETGYVDHARLTELRLSLGGPGPTTPRRRRPTRAPSWLRTQRRGK